MVVRYAHFQSIPASRRLCSFEPSIGWFVQDLPVIMLQQDMLILVQQAILREDDDRIVPAQIAESRPAEQISRFYCQFVLS